MSGHGGARAGAGRQCPVTRDRMNFTLPQALIARLRKEENMSATVELALMQYFQRTDDPLETLERYDWWPKEEVL